MALSYYVPANKFALTVNDIPFHGMPFQAEVTPEGPQNIDGGLIKLNDEQVHTGFCQYEPETFQKYVVSEGLQLTKDIFIGRDEEDGFKCTSSEVVNSVFDDLGCTIDGVKGLQSLTIENYQDQNSLQEWPLGQIVPKCHNLQSLRFVNFLRTTPACRSQLLEFAAQAIAFSSCFRSLDLENTKNTASDGA